MKLRTSLTMLIFGVVISLLGCGGNDGPPRYRVQGAVTYNGQPVRYGRITFEPDGAKGNRGPQGYALIEEGKFDTRATGTGAVGGPTTVTIHGYDGVALNDDAPFGQPLFTGHREQRELPREAATINFNVPGGT